VIDKHFKFLLNQFFNPQIIFFSDKPSGSIGRSGQIYSKNKRRAGTFLSEIVKSEKVRESETIRENVYDGDREKM